MGTPGHLGPGGKARNQRRSLPTGAHCRRPDGLSPASQEPDARLGATRQGDDSFPLTEVRLLDPARMFRAALTSRSCSTPHAEQHQCLTTSCLGPLGPVKHPQLEQARVVNRSLTMTTDLPACSPLYRSICLSVPQPLSRTAFAMRVFTS